jgi:signal peptidase I
VKEGGDTGYRCFFTRAGFCLIWVIILTLFAELRYAMALERRDCFFRRVTRCPAIGFFIYAIIDTNETNHYTSPYMRKAVLGALVFGIFIKIFLFDLMVTEGSSMMPAIKPGTVLVIGRLVYGFRIPWKDHYLLRWAAPREGDVVVFYTPAGDLAVKRCREIGDRGEFMALGDNGLQSYDSRSYGPVSPDRIIGKVLGVK